MDIARTSLSTAALLAGILVVGCASSNGMTATADPGSRFDPATGTDAATEPSNPVAPPGPPATGLDPGLDTAFGLARGAAAVAGHSLVVNSGYRTPERQQELLDEAVVEHGSLAAATRWVFPPERSMHVRGLAIDVGDGRAADWLAGHGAQWGLCRTLDWEWWHFEWRDRWEREGSCPAPAKDPSGAPAP